MILSNIFIDGKMVKKGQEVDVDSATATLLCGGGLAELTEPKQGVVIEAQSELSKLSKDELYAMAVENELAVTTKTTKAELVALLSEVE